jgi:hypothetical protein
MSSADANRIAGFLDELSAIGRDPRGGWSRLAYSAQEREAHELFRRSLEDVGLQTSGDSAGNSYGLLPGPRSSRR